MSKQPEFFESIINSALLTLTVQEYIKGAVKSLVDMPQTAFAGLLYGLMHNDKTAANAEIDNKIRRMGRRILLEQHISNARQSAEDFYDENSIAAIDLLKNSVLLADCSALIVKLEEAKRASNDNQEYIKKLNDSITSLHYLENLPLNFREIVWQFLGENSNSAMLKMGTTNLNDMKKSSALRATKEKIDLAQKLIRLLHDKKSIYINDLDLLILIIKNSNSNTILDSYSPKHINKYIFQTTNKIGSTIRNLFVIDSLSENQYTQKVFGVIGLCIVTSIYSALITIKFVQLLTTELLFSVIKMLFLGIITNLSTNKEKIKLLLIDLTKLLPEIKQTYSCLFESANKDVESETFHSKSGKQSIIKTLEKLIYELLNKLIVPHNDTETIREWMQSYIQHTKLTDKAFKELENQFQNYKIKFKSDEQYSYIFKIYDSIPNSNNELKNLFKELKTLKNISNKDLNDFIEKLELWNTYNEDADLALSVLHDALSSHNNYIIPYFKIQHILQHKNAFFDFLEVFPKRAAFTAGYNFVDYCKGRSKNNLDVNSAQHV